MTITKTQKIAAAAMSGVVIIAGAGFAKVKNDEAQAKKAAELAYANRPIIEQSCTMNGYGVGECNFTNTGKSAGAQCGSIAVNGPGTAYSDKFCSGQVAPMSTVKVEFKIPAVDELCDNGFESWTEKCSFTFVADGPLPGSSTEA